MSLTSSANVKSVKVSVPMKRVYNEKATTKKELVYVDLDELVASNDIAKFNELTEQMANGEILVVCKIESSGTCGVADLVKDYAGLYSWQIVTSDSVGQIIAISIKSNNAYMTVDVTTGYLAEEEMPLEKAKAYTDKKFSEFNFITAVPFLPETGETNKLYLVLKEESEEKNEFDEYVWANNAWEYVGSTKISGDIDLTEYVKFANIANGLFKNSAGNIIVKSAETNEIANKINGYNPIVPKTLDYSFRVAATTNTETWTEEEKESARKLINALVATPNTTGGIAINPKGILYIFAASSAEIEDKKSAYKPITPNSLDHAVKVGITTNTETLTADEQKATRDWIGAVGQNDIGTTSKAGLIRAGGSNYYGFIITSNGIPHTATYTLSEYNGKAYPASFIGKQTLENVKGDIVKRAVTEDLITLTEEEKAKWTDMIGAVKKLEPLSTPSVIVQNSDGTMVAKRIAYDNYSPLGAVSILVPADSAKNEPAGVNVTGTPKGDWDCIPKKYFDEAIGEIETALDELHTYAQNLVNGGSVE